MIIFVSILISINIYLVVLLIKSEFDFDVIVKIDNQLIELYKKRFE